MISYAIKFFLLNLLIYALYKLVLAKETQVGFLRLFLVVSTFASLLVPFLEIPLGPSPLLPTEPIILPAITLGEATETIEWYWILAIGVSLGFTVKFLAALTRIYRWYRKSERDELEQIRIRKVRGLQNSFTFFQWIFIDPDNFENPGDIVRHEQGHAQKLHSLDLLFFRLLTVVFWWVPTLWMMIKELKIIHEYEADSYAMKINDSTYRKTLVHCTLKAHGMDLASSFDDAPIFNRLNFMKKMKKKISMWKVASVITLVAVAGVLLACEDKNETQDVLDDQTTLESEASANDDSGIYNEVDETASFPGGLNAWGSYIGSNMRYPNQAQRLGVEGRVFVEFVVEKDGSLTDVKVVKGIGAGCDGEAIRVVKNSPNWLPGKINGTPVRQKYIQNILFKLPS